MDRDKIIEILASVRDGKLSVEEALESIGLTVEGDRTAGKIRLKIYNLEKGEEVVNISIPVRWVKWLITAIPHKEGLLFDKSTVSMDDLISKLSDMKEGETIDIEVPEKKIKIVFSLDQSL
jgi:hypothetical protein